MDPYESYDMIFNGAVSIAGADDLAGPYSGEDNGWALALLEPVILAFNETIVNTRTSSDISVGHRTTWCRNLQTPENPVPLLDINNPPKTKGWRRSPPDRL